MEKDNQLFINDAITSCLQKLTHQKQRSSFISAQNFLDNMFQLLIIIYSEADLTNPFLINNVGKYRENLHKYGLSYDRIDCFNNELQNISDFLNEQNNKIIKDKNPGFENIQKTIIYMLFLKSRKINIPYEEMLEFNKHLYTLKNDSFNIVLFTKLYFENPQEFSKYWVHKSFNIQHPISFSPLKKEEKPIIIDYNKYKVLGLEPDDFKNLSELDIKKLDEQLAEIAKNEAANGGRAKSNEEGKVKKLINPTSGNGFVDGIVLMSVVATIVMIVFVLYAIIMR